MFGTFETQCWHPLIYCWREGLYTKWVLFSVSFKNFPLPPPELCQRVWRARFGETININSSYDRRHWGLIQSVSTTERIQCDLWNPFRSPNFLHFKCKKLWHKLFAGQNVKTLSNILSPLYSLLWLQTVASCTVQKLILLPGKLLKGRQTANSVQKTLISSDKQRWTPPLLLYIQSCGLQQSLRSASVHSKTHLSISFKIQLRVFSHLKVWTKACVVYIWSS